MSDIWGVKLQDDLTAVSNKMAVSMENLARDTKMLGTAFKSVNVGNLTLGLKEAKVLFKASAGNMKLFAGALKDAGTSALDSRILINRFSSEVNAARRAALGMDGVWRRMFDPKTIWYASHSLNVLSKSFGAVSAVAGGALGIATDLGNKVYDSGKGLVESVLEAATTRQNTIESMAYTFQKGDVKEDDARKQAKGAFTWAQGMAKDTPLDTNVVTDALNQFLTGDFDLRQAKILTTVMADQSAKYLSKPEMPQNVINAFTRIKAKGHSSLEDFESLRTARFDPSKVRDAMAELPEVKAKLGHTKDKDARDKKLDKLMSAGSIGYMSTIQGAINSLEKDKPDLGSISKKLGGTSLQGTISNLKSAWGDMLQSQDIQDSPGVKSMQDFMNRISNVMAGTSESGKRLYATVTKVVENLMGGLQHITDSDIDGFLTKAGEAALGLSNWLKEAWDWFAKIIHSDASITDTLGEALLDVGVWIGQGLWKGATTAASVLSDERYTKKHGVARSEVQYQAKLSGKSEADVLSEYKVKKDVFDALGRSIPATPWGGDASRTAFGAVMATPVAPTLADTAPGLGVLAPSAYQTMYDLNANLGTINSMLGAGIPQMADGGLVTRPTLALIGERGPEAVVPLGMAAQLGGVGRGGSRSVTVTVNAGAGDAAQQWEAMRPLIQAEVISMFDVAAGEG